MTQKPRVRELEERDLAALSAFVTEIYKEYPIAMWFEREPSRGDLSRLLAYKLRGMREGKVVDLVAVRQGAGPDEEAIVGEVEIAKLAGAVGYIGIILSSSERSKGLGSLLLSRAEPMAFELGVSELRAEVAESNEPAFGLFKKHGYGLVRIEEGKGVFHAGQQRRVFLLAKKL